MIEDSPELVRRWREAVHGGSTRGAALALGVTRQSVCAWIRGCVRPLPASAGRMRAELQALGIAVPASPGAPACEPGDEWLLKAARQAAAGTSGAGRLVLRRWKSYVAVALDGAKTPVCRLRGLKFRDGADGAGLPGTVAEFRDSGGKRFTRRLGPRGLAGMADEMKAAVQAAEEASCCS